MRHDDDEQPGKDERTNESCGGGSRDKDVEATEPWTIEREQAWVGQQARAGSFPSRLLVLQRAQAGPDGAPADAQSLEICRQLAETNHAVACRVMARAHLAGRCADADTATGWVWMKKAADLGDLEAMTQWALEHMLSEVPEGQSRPMDYLYRAAVNRHPEAMVTMARVLLWRDPMAPASRAEAYAWLTLGATADDAESLFELWRLTGMADDVPTTEAWRNYWLRRAAELGLHAAQREWGRTQWERAESAAARIEAEGWLHRAASSGDVESAFALASIMCHEHRPQDVCLGWMLTAARGGHQQAQCDAARLIASDTSGVRRLCEAAMWLSRAVVPSPDRDEAIGNSALVQLQQLHGTMSDAQCAEVLALLSPDGDAEARAVFAGVCDLATQLRTSGGAA